MLRACLLTLLLGTAAAADLRCDASVQRPAVFQALYERAPARVRAVDVTLSVRPRGLGDRRGGYWTSYPGVGPLIGVHKQGAAAVFAHELGHHLHVQFSAEEWAEWVAFFRAHRHQLPLSEDGESRERPAEGFAEAFGRWLRGKSLRQPVQAWFEERYGADR